MPKKTKRSMAKYPALNPALNLKTRTDLIDYDYINQLSNEEKEWLNKFTEEYVIDKLDRDDIQNNIHNTPELKKDCDDRNNARNRDVLTRAQAQGKSFDLDTFKKKFMTNYSLEELTAFILDHNIQDEQQLEKILKRKLKFQIKKEKLKNEKVSK